MANQSIAVSKIIDNLINRRVDVVAPESFKIQVKNSSSDVKKYSERIFNTISEEKDKSKIILKEQFFRLNKNATEKDFNAYMLKLKIKIAKNNRII